MKSKMEILLRKHTAFPILNICDKKVSAAKILGFQMNQNALTEQISTTIGTP